MQFKCQTQGLDKKDIAYAVESFQRNEKGLYPVIKLVDGNDSSIKLEVHDYNSVIRHTENGKEFTYTLVDLEEQCKPILGDFDAVNLEKFSILMSINKEDLTHLKYADRNFRKSVDVCRSVSHIFL